MEPLRFALLGLGAGGVYALVALGVVLVYRGSGVLNFAQGAIGMTGAFVFYDLQSSAGGPLPAAAPPAGGLPPPPRAPRHPLPTRPPRAPPRAPGPCPA